MTLSNVNREEINSVRPVKNQKAPRANVMSFKKYVVWKTFLSSKSWDKKMPKNDKLKMTHVLSFSLYPFFTEKRTSSRYCSYYCGEQLNISYQEREQRRFRHRFLSGISLGIHYPGFQRIFFLIDTDRSPRSRVNEARSAERKKMVSGALSSRKHGLFHIRYFENEPLEPG